MPLTIQGFLAYHPYLTFSDSLNLCFIGTDGKPLGDLHEDTSPLFDIGQEAFKRLPAFKSKEEFDVGYKGYHAWIEGSRSILSALHGEGLLKPVTPHGEYLSEIDWEDVEGYQIAEIVWQVFLPNSLQAPPDATEAIRDMFLYHALTEIDNAIVSFGVGGRGAVAAAVAAANALSNALSIDSGNNNLQKIRRELACRGAAGKIRRDPRQQEKAFVHDCWQKWRESPSNYASKAAFARDMLAKCEHLTSQKKIEDWCREWESKNSNRAG